MVTKKIIGIFILLCNGAGLGFLFYTTVMGLMERWATREESEDDLSEKPVAPETEQPHTASDKSGAVLINDDILSDEDDLLKDMDLSDLDYLNLDDFD